MYIFLFIPFKTKRTEELHTLYPPSNLLICSFFDNVETNYFSLINIKPQKKHFSESFLIDLCRLDRNTK